MDDKLAKYESLLNELSSLEKECFHIEIDYFKEFGDEINNIFALKIESIVLKKKISYCVRKQNRNEKIVFSIMEEEINKLVEEKRKELNEMVSYKKQIDSEKRNPISFDAKREIKIIYYQIVHLIHPDLHPDIAENDKIKKLWQQSVDAYKRNDLKTLKRSYDQVLLIVDTNNTIVLENIDEKICAIEDEIKEIKDNNPYKFKFLLNDEDEKYDLHKRNHEEETYYKEYIKSLQVELSKFNIVNEESYDA